ncbi:hypothetical protein STAS_21819 [Striga asiatica]|uniref:DUF506 family protein n=1 Tax=Striga asiatica TaxID=4170 RepID=A0A5A7QIW8_STRAF|nr:hypothetical protein STAS_21819 [Striga asiatica]
MANIPVSFRRVAAAFNEMSRLQSCESSGSEHSADLSDLVNSFLEREFNDRKIGSAEEEEDSDEVNAGEAEIDAMDDQIELRDSLRKLFDLQDDAVKRSIHAEVEAVVSGEIDSSTEFKRQLMARLRGRGLDAGLCKSKWEKNGRNPSGSYEYIDVNSGGGRYVVEVNLAGEFSIARQTSSYASVLEIFPPIFVGKPEEVKKVVKLMSKAMRKSMKMAEMSVPPWRRLSYMQAKWLGFYRRTANEVPTVKAAVGMAGSRSVGFVPVTGATSFYCRGDLGVQRGGWEFGGGF